MKHNSFKRAAAGVTAVLLMAVSVPAVCKGTTDTLLTAFADEQTGIEEKDIIIEEQNAEIFHMKGFGTVQYYYFDEKKVKHIGGYPPIGTIVYVEVTPDAGYAVGSVYADMQNRVQDESMTAIKGENGVYSFIMHDASVTFAIGISYEKASGEDISVNPDDSVTPEKNAPSILDRFTVYPEGAGTLKQYTSYSIEGIGEVTLIPDIDLTNKKVFTSEGVKAVANEGWEFVKWTLDDGITSTDLTSMDSISAFEFADKTGQITAVFQKKHFTVSGNIANGQITRKVGKKMKDFTAFSTAWGSTVTFAVTPDENYTVKSVKLNGTFIEPDKDVLYSFKTPMENAAISVETEVLGHFVKFAESVENGIIFADVNAARTGETVTLNVIPNAGFQIAGVQVNDNDIQPADGVYTFTMPDEDVTVTATFEKIAGTDTPQKQEKQEIAPSDSEMSIVAAPSESDEPEEQNPPIVISPSETDEPDAPIVIAPSESDEPDTPSVITPSESDEPDTPSVITPSKQEENGKSADLPQTGNFAKGTAVCTAAAVLAVLAGIFTALKSGIPFKKKDDEE